MSNDRNIEQRTFQTNERTNVRMSMKEVNEMHSQYVPVPLCEWMDENGKRRVYGVVLLFDT